MVSYNAIMQKVKISVLKTESSDGTIIGYRKLGTGPALIIINGGMKASEQYIKLATLLADKFTVFLPDRRGRHLSGEPGSQYSMQTELDDLRALLEVSQATFVFGHSAGALITLQAARTLPQITKVAVYEPPLAIRHNITTKGWVSQFDSEIRGRKFAAAMETALAGLKLLPPEAIALPRWVRIMIMRVLMLGDWLRYRPGYTTPNALVATQKLDLPLVDFMDDTVAEFKAVKLPVLLLGGAKTPTPFLQEALKALAATLPRNEYHLFPELEHTAPATGKGAAQIAPILGRFFS